MKTPLLFLFLILFSSFALSEYASSGDNNFAMLPMDNATSAQTATGATFNITMTGGVEFATDGTNNLPMELFYSEEAVAPVIPPVVGGGGNNEGTFCNFDSNVLISVTPLSGNSLKADGTPSGSVRYVVKNISACEVKVDINGTKNIEDYLRILPNGFVLKPDQNIEIDVYSAQGRAIEPFQVTGNVVFTAKSGTQTQIIEQAISLFRDWWWIIVIILAIIAFLYMFFKRKKGQTKAKITPIPALTGQPATG